MKFRHLALGQRFEFEGRVYVKVGPVAAREESSGQLRMIPSYGVLKPAGDVPAAVARATAKPVSRDAVLAAFDKFYAECVDVAAGSPHVDARARLEAARQRFLDSL